MSRFIKLTKILVNINNITSISIQPNKYLIHLAKNNNDGFGMFILGSGLWNSSSTNYQIEVCETEHQDDYKIVSEWIKNI